MNTLTSISTVVNSTLASVFAVNPDRYGIRAPKGGCTVNGKVFKGGQFCLPYDVANPHGIVADQPAVNVPAPKMIPARPAPIRIGITGFAYDVRQVPAGECGSIAFEMDKFDEGRKYYVVLNHFNEVTCDCPDFELRRAGTGQPCKHGRALLEKGLIVRRNDRPRVQVAAMAKPKTSDQEPALRPLRSAETVRPVQVREPRRAGRFEPTPEEIREADELFRAIARD